jgi:hypothetical protein
MRNDTYTTTIGLPWYAFAPSKLPHHLPPEHLFPGPAAP